MQWSPTCQLNLVCFFVCLLFGFVIDIIFYGFVVQHMPSVLGAVGKLARETKKKHNSIEYDAIAYF